MAGFIVMPRGWMDNPVFGHVKRAPFSRRDAWMWLVESAAYQPTTRRVGLRDIELQRGQTVVSLQYLVSVWGWHTMKVSRVIAALVAANMIETRSDIAGTIITICNYDQFCGAPCITDTPSESHRDTRRASTDTGTKEGNKLSPNGERSNTRATRLPNDFEVPLDWIEDGAMARVKAKMLPVDLATEAVKFANHFLSKGGAAAAKIDWHRTWVNWCLNAKGPMNERWSKGRPHAEQIADLGDWARQVDEREGIRGDYEAAD